MAYKRKGIFNDGNVQKAAKFAFTAARAAFKKWRSKTGTSHARRTGHETGTVTNQYDSQRLYTRKPAPKKLKKKLRKFAKKVRRVVDDVLIAPQYVVRTGQLANNSSAGAQSVTSCSLYGANGMTNIHNDLAVIFNNVGSTNKSQQQLEFCTGVLDLYMSNIHATNTALIDVYTICCRKDVATYSTNTTPEAMWGQWLSDQGLASGGSAWSSLGTNTVGSTPFLCQDFCRHFIIKAKRRFVLSAGQSASMQWRNPKYYQVKYDDLNNILFPSKMYTAFLIVQRGDLNTTPAVNATTMAYNYTRSYNFRDIGNNNIAGAGTG